MALNKLSPAQCAKTNKPGYFNDGGGLYLSIKTTRKGTISKSWVFRYRSRTETYASGVAKLKEKGLGTFGPHDVTLKDARELAGQNRQYLRDGLDPIEVGRKQREEQRQQQIQAQLAKQRNVTFWWCAEQWMKVQAPGWKNGKHAAQVRTSLFEVAALLHQIPVAEIGTQDVLNVLKPIWETKNESASRLRGRIESVLGWATVSGYRTGDNPARWRNHLAAVLPKPSAVQKVKHFAALNYAHMGDFMKRLRKNTSIQARALEFLILTAARPHMVASTRESKGARWDEIDLKSKTWTLSAERMKAKKEMVIPLSTQAVRLLKSLHMAGDYLFPGRSLDKSISDGAMLKIASDIAKEMNVNTTAHGLRSTFRDWAGETTAHPREVIEMALAHQLKDKAEAAYARGNLLAKRRKLMEDWANYCNLEPRHSASVTPIGKGARNA